MNYSKPNRELPFREVGTGMVLNFRCARCNLAKQMDGRRKQKVQGLLQYVCRACVK